MSTAKINILNQAGRQVDSVVVYHSPTPPLPVLPLSDYKRAIKVLDLADGATSPTQTVTTQSGDPEDYWLGAVLFEGDGTPYIMCTFPNDAYVTYGVDNGKTLTLTIPAYKTDSTDQGFIKFDDHTGDPLKEPLLNQTNADIIGWADLIYDIVQVLKPGD